MLTVLSPAKSLDMEPVAVAPTEPGFAADATRLAKTARNLTLARLKGLMGLSDDLARLNRDRFRDFAEAPQGDRVKPAVLAFAGDTYRGLAARTLSEDDLRWAQERLRILSGLYGLLRPLDGIQPYRLVMGARLKTRRGQSLYDYWGDNLAKALNRQAEAVGADLLLNCASREYFSVAGRPALKLRVVTPVFLEEKDGRARMVSFFAKRARGAMARFVIENRLTEAEGLRDFAVGGYACDAERSAPDRPVFVRPCPDAKG